MNRCNSNGDFWETDKSYESVLHTASIGQLLVRSRSMHCQLTTAGSESAPSAFEQYPLSR